MTAVGRALPRLTGDDAPCSNLCYCARAVLIAELARMRGSLEAIKAMPDKPPFSPRELRMIKIARGALEQSAPGEREYDPNVMPCDDAEFGMKP